ncbi:VOC family protein [Pseudogemmobacter sonorensis]|uniref:VOC family protein n=1 Tax=Pseudogemmobacter sonorensis TaxID=2989681 RepID=UPI00368C69F2
MTKTLELGRVALIVNDLGRVAEWYRTAVGLHLLSQSGGVAQLGTKDATLLELREDGAARRRAPREAGLFHTAFLLPSRAALGAWVLDASARRTRLDGASDHEVSEAVYLTDPEGNGVEIYADRPAGSWRHKPNGEVEMGTYHLDLPALVEAAGGAQWQGFPEGSTVGHVHLQVGALPEAEAFYKDLLGLEVTNRYPGANFYAADGYHHHIATNIWNSRGAGRRDMPSTGLAEVEIRMAAGKLDAIRAAFGANSGRFTIEDPWGTPVAIDLI